MTGKVVLELRNVSKIYGEGSAQVKALDDVSFKVHKGEYIVIIGPSGSGKSTLLHMMGLLDEPSKGEVFVEGVNTVKLDEKQTARIRNRKIGFVFQTFNLIYSLSGLENVIMPQTIKEVKKEIREKRGMEVMAKLGIEKRAHHLPSEMSGGERQRVAVARALINDPDIILADEPTGNLDTKRGEELIEILKKLNKEGKTIIIITHDLDISKKAKKVIKIKDGKIVKRI